MTESAVVAELRRRVMAAGSMTQLARAWGVPVVDVRDCLNSRRSPGPSILGPMGIRRVAEGRYEKVKLKP